MRDTPATLFRAAMGARTIPRVVMVAMLLAAAGGLGGCANSGGASNAFAMVNSTGSTPSPTVTFESIDGPPPQVFERMVSMLDSESKLRNLAIVSREGTASYRVRSYLSAQIVRGRTTIAWVWDVYDRDQLRALRLAGEEPASSKSGRDAWTAADDLVLRKIAQAGLSGLSGLINGTVPADAPQPVPTPDKRGPAVASADEPPSDAETFAALGYSAR